MHTKLFNNSEQFFVPARPVFQLARRAPQQSAGRPEKAERVEPAVEASKRTGRGKEIALTPELADSLQLPRDFMLAREFAKRAEDEWKSISYIRRTTEKVRTSDPAKYESEITLCRTQEEKLRNQIIAWGEAIKQLRASRDRLDSSRTPEVFSFNDFSKRVENFKKRFEKESGRLDAMNPATKERFVLDMRRRTAEITFLSNYAQENLTIEMQGDHAVLREDENQTLDLTELETYLKNTDAKLRTIQLYEDLEKKRRTIRPKDFLKLSQDEKLQLVTNLASWRDIKPGTLVVINFGGNELLEQQIGLGDLMPPDIREFEMNGITYSRRGNQGFYYQGSYLPIFNGSRVTIKRRDEHFNAEQELQSKFVAPTLRRNDTRRSSAAPQDGVAADFGVDAYFLESLLAVMKNGDVNENITDREEFMHSAARYIQNAEAAYESSTHTAAVEKGHYTAEFIVFALDHFSLFNTYTGQDQAVVESILVKYGALRKIELKFNEKIKTSREKAVPKKWAEIAKTPRGSTQYRGEIRYAQDEICAPTAETQKNAEKRLAELRQHYESLVAQGSCSREEADKTLASARIIYQQMNAHAGSSYNGTVGIARPDGSPWYINNNCVGAAMKACEGTDFKMQSGRQSGTPIYNFYWGHYRDGTTDFRQHPWLKCMVRNPNDVISELVTPENADAVIGEHLAPGECAPAGLWNHALWLYKDFDGKIMMHHSGADVRPRKITAHQEEELPPGYKRSSENPGTAFRFPGSKVNDVPLSYFLAHTKDYRPPRNEIAFVPLHVLVKENLA